MTKYCISQSFNPKSIVLETADEINFITLIYISIGALLALGMYIIFKMCQLCSKVFSYSNFHIHEAYKFYTLALISTITILISRLIEFQFAENISQSNLDPDQKTPFRENPYYKGWIMFNELIGVISLFCVNIMYVLNSLTWLMIAHNCDFNKREEYQEIDDQEEQRKRKYRKNFLLYLFLPLFLIFSVFGILKNEQGWCLSSRILSMTTNFFVYVLFIYSLFNIFMKKYRDIDTPKKIKIIWVYVILAMTARQISSWILQVQDFVHPSIEDYFDAINGSNKKLMNVLILVYTVTITVAPIFLLSYLADKQLEVEKSQSNSFDKQSREMKEQFIQAPQYDTDLSLPLFNLSILLTNYFIHINKHAKAPATQISYPES